MLLLLLRTHSHRHPRLVAHYETSCIKVVRKQNYFTVLWEEPPQTHNQKRTRMYRMLLSAHFTLYYPHRGRYEAQTQNPRHAPQCLGHRQNDNTSFTNMLHSPYLSKIKNLIRKRGASQKCCTCYTCNITSRAIIVKMRGGSILLKTSPPNSLCIFLILQNFTI